MHLDISVSRSMGRDGQRAAVVVRAVLAFAGVPGIILALLALFALTSDYTRVDALSRVLQGAMLAIIGFYFGRVDVSRAYRAAETARSDAAELADDARTVAAAAEKVSERTERAELV